MASDANKGVYVLSEATKAIFWASCSIFLAGMVTVTCFTTTAGLIVSTGEFFHNTFPKISYKVYATVFTLIGFAIANLGLSAHYCLFIACLDDPLSNHHYYSVDCDCKQIYSTIKTRNATNYFLS